jgi:UDP-N-acetyl-D-mannosaminuronate dehydrogenase
MPKFTIVGLGYVGFPLSLQLAKACATVFGFGVDQAKAYQ